VNTCTAAANSSEISNTKGIVTVGIYSTLRHLLVLLQLYQLYNYYGIQHTVNKLVVSRTVENYLSTSALLMRCCCYADSDTTLCSEKKHPLTFSAISPWKMFRFIQNFQGMFKMNQAFHRRKSYIFIAIGDVILTSYLHVCK